VKDASLAVSVVREPGSTVVSVDSELLGTASLVLVHGSPVTAVVIVSGPRRRLCRWRRGGVLPMVVDEAVLAESIAQALADDPP
jgi:hypothetical protein